MPGFLSSEYPPFPNGLPEIELPRLSYTKLSSGDPQESNALFKAAVNNGVFYLDFAGSAQGEELLQEAAKAFEVGKEFFELPDAEKTKHMNNFRNIGYKPLASIKLPNGKNDWTEIYTLLRDAVMDPSLTVLPDTFADRRSFMKSTFQKCHAIALVLLARLAAELDISFESLEAFHKTSEPSLTGLRFNHIPPQQVSNGADTRSTSFLSHTDNGTVTINFAPLGGLQVLDSLQVYDTAKDEKEDQWRWVRPMPHCAVVNICDGLVHWTNGILRSVLHRVQFAPGEQGRCERYSFGYFLKPADNTPMKRIQEGRVIPRLTKAEAEAEAKEDWAGRDYKYFHTAKNKFIVKEGRNIVRERGGAVHRPKEVSV